MLGKIGEMGNMIAMQRRIKKMQAELQAEIIEVEVEGGAMVLRVNGEGNLVSLEASDELWADRIRFVKAQIKGLAKGREVAQKMMAEKMKSAGIGLPGLGG